MPLTDHDRSHVQNSALLGALPPALLAQLLNEQNLVDLEKNQVLFRQGEPATLFFLQLQGQVKLVRSIAGGEEAVVHVFGPGDSFAEAAMFMGGKFPVSAIAVTAGRVLAIPAHDLREPMRDNPEIAFAVLASMSKHLKGLVDQIEGLKALNGEDRIVKFILKHAPARNRSTRFDLPYEESLIAGELGMKPETFSRALASLRLYGVSTEGRSIEVASLERLQRKLTEL